MTVIIYLLSTIRLTDSIKKRRFCALLFILIFFTVLLKILSMKDINLIIGVSGMVLLLGAFALNLLKVKTQDSHTYVIMNILGGGISTYYAVTLDAVPFVILEAVWTAFAVYKLAQISILLKKTSIKDG